MHRSGYDFYCGASDFSFHYIQAFVNNSNILMKLSLLLLSLLPLFAQARDREEDDKHQHERPEKQYVRRVKLQKLPDWWGIVSCADSSVFCFDW
jgi:hypothetical protein